MALKFRRGTTAQKSGSLAFGEPYVNTTLGTLQLGGANGDITLLINSSSQGISGSSLDITGNAKIDGNLTLGGNITIGDQTTDTVTVNANLSSSLIPSATNTFDLGSTNRIWRDLYISTGSIKFIDGGAVVNTFSSNTLTTILQSTGSTDSKFSTLATYTGSVDTRFTQIGVVSGSLISSASADRVSITNINTFSGSQLTQNSSLATITGSLIVTASNSVQRLGAIETVSGSWITESETSSFARTNTSNTFVGNQSVTGDLTISGIITANEFHTAYVTSSVMYNSGSNRFGDSADDLQQLIGIVEITGSIKGTQFNNLATITGSLISSASSFESRNASLATITGSLITTASNNVVSITNINTETASLESRASQIAILTGSLISSASSFESRNASLATLTGSLILTASNHEQRIVANESISSSYARTNLSNTFNNDQTISGSINLTGRVNAQLAVSASGLNVNKADGNVQIELSNSTTGRGFHLISYNGDSFSIHNPVTGLSAFRIDSGSQYHSHFFGNIYALSGSIVTSNGITGSLSGSVSGIGNVTAFSSSLSSQNSSLATITGSLITTASNNVVSIANINTTTASLNTSVSNINTFSSSQLTQNTALATITGSLITTASNNVVSITNINAFSSSQLTQNSSLATITGSLITTASNNTISVANLNSYTSSLNNAIQLTGSTVSFLGNIVVYGTQSILYSENLQVNDNIIYLSPSGAADVDLGIVGHYNDGTYRHGGIFRDASDSGAWKVFKGLTPETSGTVDTTHPSFALADFKAAVFTGTSFNGTINADNGVVSGSSQVIGILSSLNTYTSSNDTTNTTQNTRLTALEASASTALSTNNTQDVSITNLNSTTASLNTSVSNLNTYTSSFAAASVALTNKTISGASNTLTNIGNSSLTNSSITIAGTSTSLGGTISAATIGNAIGAFSGSSQVDLTSTTNYASGILNRLNAVGVVSGSSQIVGSSITTNTVTIGSTSIALGGTATTISGLSSVSSTGFTGALTGNASTATTLQTARLINGTSFDGSSNITIQNLVSGSSQITLSGVTGYGSILNQAVLTSSSPTFAGLTINGAITATGDITAYYSSDKRYKNNIQPITDALAKVRALNGVTWEWNDDVSDVTKAAPKTGLIAQEVQSVLPEVVKEKEDGYLGLDYAKMMGLMVEAIKEQQLQIDKLTLKVTELEKQKGL